MRENTLSADLEGMHLQWFAEEGTTLTTDAPDAGDAAPAEDAAVEASEPEGGEEPGSTLGDKPTGWRATLRPDQQNHPLAGKFRKNPEVFDELVKLHEAAEKGIVPPGEDATVEEIDAYYQKLGRPEKPEGYELSAGDGEQTKQFAEWYKKAAFEAGLTKEQAERLYNSEVERRSDEAKVRQSAQKRAQEKAVNELRQEWGDDFDPYVKGAQRMIAQFGGSEFIEMLNEEKADGTRIGDDPRIVRAMVQMYQQVASDSLVEADTDGQSPVDGKYRYPGM